MGAAHLAQAAEPPQVEDPCTVSDDVPVQAKTAGHAGAVGGGGAGHHPAHVSL